MAKQNVAPARKSRVTSKDVAILLMTDGMQAVRDLHAENGIAPGTIDSAIELLKGKPDLASALQGFRDATFKPSEGQRGRPGVTIGGTRAYKAQQVGENGDRFIRLPVSLLGAVKEQKVFCTFNADKTITVSLTPVAGAEDDNADDNG